MTRIYEFFGCVAHVKWQNVNEIHKSLIRTQNTMVGVQAPNQYATWEIADSLVNVK